MRLDLVTVVHVSMEAALTSHDMLLDQTQETGFASSERVLGDH